jgi:lipopolysaccharide transport system ATP-binding protein
MAIAIKAENISKQYRLGYVGSGSLKDDAKRWWARMRGKEDPLLTVGETNDRSIKGESDYVWALKDINFEIEQGDTVGIIGRNGAGKSTLLKLLSKVTAPTTGNFKVKGRIASLLEVGTGFHGELTGRENIYLNGAIMGMRKHEITRKLDEIVDFSGVERYLDTPVKRYSSGMYVRLGFAVAAHLENEILIVDEVLAVGDAEFQKKCLGKMGDVSKGEGRTVIFVSHNMASIKTLCKKGIFLENGFIKENSTVDQAIQLYFSNNIKNEFYFENVNYRFVHFKIFGESSQEKLNISNGEEFYFEFNIEIKSRCETGFGFCIAIYNETEDLLSAINTYHLNEKIDNLKNGKYSFKIRIPRYIFNTGNYNVNFHFNNTRGEIITLLENIATFNIYDDGFRRGNKFAAVWPGKISLVPNISIENV